MSLASTTWFVPPRRLSLLLSSWTMTRRIRTRANCHARCPRRRPFSRLSPAGCLAGPPCEQPDVVYRVCLWRGPARCPLQAKLALRSGDRKTVAGSLRRHPSAHHYLAAALAQVAVHIGGFAGLVPRTSSVGTRCCGVVLGLPGPHPCE